MTNTNDDPPARHWTGNAILKHDAYLAYLEQCARLWESPPYNSPAQAAEIREKASRLRLKDVRSAKAKCCDPGSPCRGGGKTGDDSKLAVELGDNTHAKEGNKGCTVESENKEGGEPAALPGDKGRQDLLHPFRQRGRMESRARRSGRSNGPVPGRKIAETGQDSYMGGVIHSYLPHRPLNFGRLRDALIRELRRTVASKKTTQTNLAARIGISGGYLAHLIAGNVELTALKTADRILAALNLDVTDLLSQDDNTDEETKEG